MSARGTRKGDLVWLTGAAVLVAFLALRFGGGEVSVPDFVGKPLPPLMVEGWLNRPEGATVDAAGQVLVVDCWASWCGPCMAELPGLAKIAAEYQPLGVKFLGVTSESSEEIPDVERAIARVKGFDWPVAYGGYHFFDALGVSGTPTMFVFGSDGRCRWVANGIDGLADELDKALTVKGSASRLAARHRDDAG